MQTPHRRQAAPKDPPGTLAGGKKLTKRGFERLTKEYETLAHIERPKVVRGVSDAAAEGDRSENAEYIYGKKRLREIDKRLGYLGKLLKGVTVVDPSTLSGDRVVFGATVHIEDEHGEAHKWTIVGHGEADAREGTVSVNSPMAKALLNKRIGDIAEVRRPKGDLEVEIVALTFGEGDPT